VLTGLLRKCYEGVKIGGRSNQAADSATQQVRQMPGKRGVLATEAARPGPSRARGNGVRKSCLLSC